MIKIRTTNQAIEFGESATPEQINRVYKKRLKIQTKFEKSMKTMNLEKALIYQNMVQLLDEAWVAYKRDPAFYESIKHIKGI